MFKFKNFVKVLIIILFAGFVLAACVWEDEDLGIFVPGTWEGHSDNTYSHLPQMTHTPTRLHVSVTVDANAITAIELGAHGDTPGFDTIALNSARGLLIGRSDIIGVMSPANDATYTTNAIIEAVGVALNNARR